MKSLYRCDKCGKISENYDEINQCEQMHYSLNRPWDDLNGTLEEMTEYKEGQAEPNVIHLVFERSYWTGDEWKTEKRCGKYKLVSSYDEPLVITDK